MQQQQQRGFSVAGSFHKTAFFVLAALACYSHGRAMMTDPGAVPPDAKPLPPPPLELLEEEGFLSPAAATAITTAEHLRTSLVLRTHDLILHLDDSVTLRCEDPFCCRRRRDKTNQS
jgi:hypothetical protein